MSQTSTLEGQCIAEFLGTGLLIFFGVDCVAALRVVRATSGQWKISVIWGLGVAMVTYLTASVSGAHLNPTVTIALWLFAYSDKCKAVSSIILQIVGAFCATVLVYGLCYNLFLDFEQANHVACDSTESLDLVGTFSTYPGPHINFVQTLVVGMVVTTALMGLVLTLTNDGNGIPRGPLAPLLVGLLTAATGASMGPLTGFAINPARDFGPGLFAWMAGWGEIAFTSGCDIPYFLVPVFGPITGVILGAWAYRKLIGHHLPYDIYATEKKDVAVSTQQEASQ